MLSKIIKVSFRPVDTNSIFYYVPFLIVYLLAFCVIIFTILKSNYDNDLTKRIYYNINGWILLFLSSFCTLPLIESCILINSCGDSFYYTCFSPTHIILIIVGIIFLIILVGFLSIVAFLFQLPYATSKIPWSLISSNSNLIILLVKVGLGFVHNLDPEMSLGILYTLVLIIFEVLQVWMPFTNPIYSSVLIYFSNLAFNFWGLSQLLFNLYSFITRGLPFNPYCFIFFQTIAIAGFILLRLKRKINTFLKLWINKNELDLKSLFDSETYFSEISNSKSNLNEKVYFLANINSHKDVCQVPNCKCKKFIGGKNLLLMKNILTQEKETKKISNLNLKPNSKFSSVMKGLVVHEVFKVVNRMK